MSILLGNGDGTFQPAAGYGSDTGPAELYGVAIADFNRDGKLDFAVADNDAALMRVFLGNGDGTFSMGPVTPLAASVSGLATADFNLDGTPDLAILTDAPGVSILTGNGDGSFTDGASFAAQPGFWLSAADLNSDGDPDLAVLSGNNLVQVFLGEGNGTFGSAVSTYTGIDPGKRNLTVADFNGDGSPDLAAPNYDGGSVTVLLNRCPAK